MFQFSLGSDIFIATAQIAFFPPFLNINLKWNLWPYTEKGSHWRWRHSCKMCPAASFQLEHEKKSDKMNFLSSLLWHFEATSYFHMWPWKWKRLLQKLKPFHRTWKISFLNKWKLKTIVSLCVCLEGMYGKFINKLLLRACSWYRVVLTLRHSCRAKTFILGAKKKGHRRARELNVHIYSAVECIFLPLSV